MPKFSDFELDIQNEAVEVEVVYGRESQGTYSNCFCNSVGLSDCTKIIFG